MTQKLDLIGSNCTLPWPMKIVVINSDDPIRREILVLIPRTLIRPKNLQMSSLDLVDGPDVRAFAVYDRHTFDH